MSFSIVGDVPSHFGAAATVATAFAVSWAMACTRFSWPSKIHFISLAVVLNRGRTGLSALFTMRSGKRCLKEYCSPT